MRKTQLLVLSLLLVMLLAACAPKAAPAAPQQAPLPATQAPAPAPASVAPAKPAWQERWEKTLADARKEGKVMLATTGAAETRTAMVEGFKSTYGIPVEAVSGKGADILTKVLAERRAGLYFWDVFVGGTSTPLSNLKPVGAIGPLEPALILPELTDPEMIKKVWWQGKLWWIDRDHTIVAGLMFPDTPLAINTNLVKPGEIKSYNDLLDPKWKGKILYNDPTVPGISGSSFTPMMNDVMSRDWLYKLAKNEPIVIRDQRLQLDWLAHGKVPILLAPKTDVYFEFMRKGTPVQAITPKEGTWLSAGSCGISIFDRPSQPNAAKVFINWLLSKEGMTIYSKVYGGQSAREDVPTDFLTPEQIRQPGVKYWEKEREEVLLQGPEMYKIAKDIFGHLMK